MRAIGFLGHNNMAKHNEFGAMAEQKAVNFLKEIGYEVLKRNWRFLHAEIDIIATDPVADEIVIVEVKARGFTPLIDPEDAINNKKKRLLVKAADEFITTHAIESETRFDIITIEKAQPNWKINHIKDAFSPHEL